MEVLKSGITGTQMMKMVHRSDIPKDRKVTYARFVCNYIPQKEEANGCCIGVVGERLEYTGYLSTKMEDLTTIKCLLNSVLSKLRARFMAANVNNLYVNTRLDIPEYMSIAVLPQQN